MPMIWITRDYRMPNPALSSVRGFCFVFRSKCIYMHVYKISDTNGYIHYLYFIYYKEQNLIKYFNLT